MAIKDYTDSQMAIAIRDGLVELLCFIQKYENQKQKTKKKKKKEERGIS